MQRKVTFVICALLSLLLFSSVAMSDGVDAGSFIRDGIGARAFGLGGAFVSVADDTSTTVWNPAGLAQLQGVNLGGMYTEKFGLGIYFQSLGTTAKVEDFGFGLNVVWSSIEDIPYHGDGEGEFFSETQMLFLGSAAYDLSGILDSQAGSISELLIGGSAKYYRHTLLEGKGTGLGFDLGLLATFSLDWGEISLGLASQDVGGTAITWSGTDHNPVNDVPWMNRVGISVALLDQSLRLASGIDVAIGRPHLNQLHLGAEYWPIGQLAVRAGMALGENGTRQFSAGASVKWQGISLDYAYVPNMALGVSHVLSAQFNFPGWWQPKQEEQGSTAQPEQEEQGSTAQPEQEEEPAVQ